MVICQPIIETERLVLRPFESGDIGDVVRLAGNPRVSETTLNIPYPYEAEMAMEWISSHKADWNDRSRITFAITHKQNNSLLGAIGVLELNSKVAKLGYWIGEPYWGMGFCTEAVVAMIDFTLQSLGASKIYAEHLSSNPASGKVMQKVGMRYVRTTQMHDRYGMLSAMEIDEITNE